MSNYIDDVRAVVGNEYSLIEERIRNYFAYDNLREFTVPAVVVFPKNIDEIKEIIKIASKYGVPVVPRGSGTGRTGGAASIDSRTIIVSMLRFNRIIDVDVKNRLVITEPGVINADLHRAVEKLELFYPPDPASMEMCTIGGNIAENAGGPRAVKYGVTSNYLMNLTAVFGNGSIYQGDRYVIKNVSSYNIPQMLIASEGTFGIITRSAHRLLNKPETINMAIVPVSEAKNFSGLFYDIMHRNINPMSVEFLDRKIVKILSKSQELIDSNAYASLLIEIDGNENDVKNRMTLLKDIIQGRGDIFVASRGEEIERIREIRRAISPAITRLYKNKFSCDIVVPVSNIPNVLDYLDNLSKKSGVDIMSFGHAGDGNLHVNVLYDESLPNKKEIERAVIEGAVKFKGTITGEHGIGIRNLDYLNLIFSEEEIDLFKSIKKAFDPNLIMNPGKKISI